MYHVGAALQIFCQSVSIWMVLHRISSSNFIAYVAGVFFGGGGGGEEKSARERATVFPPHFTAPLRARVPRSTKEPQTTQAKDFKVRLK